MKKPRRKSSRLSKDASDHEIIRWTTSNDVFDRLEAGVSKIIKNPDWDAVLHEAIQDNTAQLNMRLSPAMKRCSRSWPASAPRMQRLSLVSGWPSVWSGN